ncbi:MFS transporter [Cupriavidus sp. USMAA2-4]|uniref:MFS transporter n=1 Tax=Cupriavidus malaysiensis TaxID=367825 RepID=A0ABN4TES0_9BURK|nr:MULTISPECIES: MFS transporter [Cupriavidus]AOY91592.1 MFS transporter [Cupriavidus sp. USMAA2-4]AOY98859.1 MFS transporter [Cupriavidus sp. USMAHM13]AOZ05283.1 MFS transporter [Cupriavidus malaysiensis]
MADTLTTSPPQGTARADADGAPAAAAGVYQPRKAWAIATWLTAFSAINFLDKVVLGMVAVPLMRDLQLTPTQFGVVAGSFFWLFSISAAVVGFVGNRVPARWLLLAMAVLWSLVQFPVALASSATALLVSRVILGAGEGPGFPVSVHALYKWFPHEKRNLPVSLINQGATIGLLLAGLGVPLVTHQWGWRANFVVLAAASLLWALGWLIWGREGTLRTEVQAGGSEPARAQAPVSYRRLLTDTTVLCGFLTGFAAYWGLALALTWLPSYLEQGLGFDAAAAGRMFAIIVAAGVPVSMGLSWCSQRMLRRGASSRSARVVFSCVCVGLGGVLLLALPLLPLPPGGKVALLAVSAVLPPITFALGPAVLGEIVPDAQRSALIAISTAVSTSAGAVAPVVMGKLVQAQSHAGAAHGFELGFGVCGAVMVAGCLVGILGQHPERTRQRLRA